MTGILETVGLATRDQIEKLLRTGDTYDAWLAWLKTERPKYAGTPMLAEIDATIARGESTRASILGVVQKARDAWAWLKAQTGDAVTTVKQWFGLAGIEALPAGVLVALGATAILSATYAMTQWVNGDAAQLKIRLDNFNKARDTLVAQGVDPVLATQTAGAQYAGMTQADTVNAGPSLGDKALSAGSKLILTAILLFAGYKVAEKKGWI